MTEKKFILILIAATFLAYFSSFSNPFIWDDEQFIAHNVYVQNFDIAKIFTTNTVAGAGVVSNYYRPLTSLSFAIDTKIWGQNPFGFHLTNFLLHLGAGLVLFGLLLELFSWITKSSTSRYLAKQSAELYPAFSITLFFLIHPVQTEAVTYINSRGDSLYALFLFASLWLFALSLREANNVSDAAISTSKRLFHPDSIGVRNDAGKSLLIIFLFLLSLLSKETVIAGVGLYIVIFLFCQGRSLTKDRPLMHSLWVIGGIGIITVGYFLFRFTVLNFSNTLNYYPIQDFYSTHLWVRLFTFCKVLWIYIGLLVWPSPLHMERSITLVKSFFSWEVLGIVGLFGLLGIVGFWELRKQGSGWILFGMSWFLIMLMPVSGIIPINGILYEHWLYVPMVGFFLGIYGILGLLGSWISSLRRANNVSDAAILKSKRLLHQFRLVRNDKNALWSMHYTLCIALAVIYILLTIHQNNLWSDPITFYTYTLSFAPNSARLHNNLAMSLDNVGQPKEAVSEYEKALALGPGYPQIYNNLGNTYIQLGKYTKAELYLKKAIRMSPQFTVARVNLIKLYIINKEYDKAMQISGNNLEVEKTIEQLESSHLQ